MPVTRKRSTIEAVDEFRYLTAQEATGRYRTIMRYFFDQHRLHQYTLSPSQVRAHVARERGLDDYPEELCQKDLEQLASWGNLEPDWEMGLASVKSIEDFRRRNVVYAATPDAIAIENLLRDLERQGEQVGELDSSAMGQLWALCDTLETALSLPADDPRRPEQVRQTWEGIWRLFSETADSSNDYMGDMRRQEKERLVDLSAFQLYKEALITYLTRFIEGLTAHRDRFRTRLAAWPLDALAAELARAAHLATRQFESLDFLVAEYRDQLEGFVAWFAPGGSADQLHKFAGHAIERVLHSARRLSESRLGALSRAQDLLALADAFYSLRHETAKTERLAGLAFALTPPRHWEYVMPEQAAEDPAISPWRSPPLETVIRQRRTNAARQNEAANLAETALKKAALLRRDRERRAAAAAVIDRLFVEGSLTLGEAPLLSPDERDMVLGWVYDCLSNSPAYATRAEDGSDVHIANHAERRHVWLEAADGRMLLPNFRLDRVREGSA